MQLKEVKHFIQSLPPNVQVLVGYMQNGTVRHEGGFTTNHEAAASKCASRFRLPGVSASPYFCLSEFVKHWPGQGNAARMVLMITNGVDPYNGSVSPLNQDSPYVQAAQNDASVPGWRCTRSTTGMPVSVADAASFSGQSYLSRSPKRRVASRSTRADHTAQPGALPERVPQSISESYLVTFNASANREKRNTLRTSRSRLSRLA